MEIARDLQSLTVASEPAESRGGVLLPGSQDVHVRAEPENFFVPPYVGPRGWLGVMLDRGIAWKRVAALVREAYEKVAPGELQARIGKTPALKAPSKTLSASQIDPLKSPHASSVLKGAS